VPGLHLSDLGLEAAFSAPQAHLLELCFFDDQGAETRHPLDRGDDGMHRGVIAGITEGARYGLRTHGPWQPEEGIWHDPHLLLVDPHARALAGTFIDHPSVHHSGPREDTARWVPRGVVISTPPSPRPGPRTPWEDTVIYETHVRGLTMQHPDIPPELRGTFAGAAAEPVIEHLLRLGVTAVELMPVAHHVNEPFLQAKDRSNYWGYSTLAWFAPHAGYATGDDGRQVSEFASMVDAFHAAGIEVILDVVFNHTGEGGPTGPILSMKGLDASWYRLDDGGGFIDWTGTGNTVDTASPMVRASILEALRWWAGDLGVDGFRFDLGVTLGRDENGFSADRLAWISEDPDLARLKLIAEPWDLGPDGYRLGGFGSGWAEWNDRFRDDVRDLWRGHVRPGDAVHRLTGSPDIFGPRAADASVNFVTAHDGFTLRDLVSYDRKRNLVNGEDDRDGHDDNRSWNSGTEGPTDDPLITEIRRRRAAALLTTLLVSAGVPMLLGGDELGRSQGGNNNAYSLDSPDTWLNWSAAPHVDLITRAVGFRRRHRGVLANPTPRVVGDGPVVELGNATGSIVFAANPASEPADLTLPDGVWTLELDSSDLSAYGTWSSTVTVPAWTVRLLVPSPETAKPDRTR